MSEQKKAVVPMDKNAKIYVAGHRGMVGSAIVRLIAEHGKNSPQYVYEYVKSMKEGMRT